jgi:hypothetical protein
MKDVFARLGADFFSTILFIAIYLAIQAQPPQASF